MIILKLFLKKIIPSEKRRRLRDIQHSLINFFSPGYQSWIKKYDQAVDKSAMQQISFQPLISVVVVGERSASLAGSFQRQTYSNWEYVERPDLAKSEWLAFVQPCGRLADDALYQMVRMLNQDPSANLVYADIDYINPQGKRCRPYFKPDWDPFLFLSHDYLLPFFIVQKKWAAEPKNAPHIKHAPFILYHSYENRSCQYSEPVFSLPTGLPFISIIIPTKDGVEMLKACISSIIITTKVAQFEIIIINNNSEQLETINYFKAIASDQVRVLDYPYPFNYSAINNFAVKQARGDILLFLNDDVEAISKGWIESMLGILLQPNVGIVGATLYYPDLTLQHAGVIIDNNGAAIHINARTKRKVLTRCFSAVTGACLMIKKSIFEQVGGFDEVLFPITFNDIDLCGKVRELGALVVLDAHAKLYHKESATRGSDASPEKKARAEKEAKSFLKKWNFQIGSDPYYNPNLSFKLPGYGLAFPPRVSRK